jgi:hypothetical protein
MSRLPKIRPDCDRHSVGRRTSHHSDWLTSHVSAPSLGLSDTTVERACRSCRATGAGVAYFSRAE